MVRLKESRLKLFFFARAEKPLTQKKCRMIKTTTNNNNNIDIECLGIQTIQL